MYVGCHVMGDIYTQSFTSLSIHTENIGSAVCFTSSLTFIILARCQFSIQLFFNYSSFVTDGGTVLNISEYTVDYEQQNRQLLVELPVSFFFFKRLSRLSWIVFIDLRVSIYIIIPNMELMFFVTHFSLSDQVNV